MNLPKCFSCLQRDCQKDLNQKEYLGYLQFVLYYQVVVQQDIWLFLCVILQIIACSITEKEALKI